MNRVSIIIPVYNAEKTLDICLQSLEKQTYTDIEYIFINDCSTDNSLKLIENFAFTMQKKGIIVKVISHDVNGGVAKARNTGLENATGDFIYYIDADDYVDSEAIETMVKTVIGKDLDILGIEWNLCLESCERYMKQKEFSSSKQALINMMCGVMRWNLWLFMVKRSLYTENKIKFDDGQDMGEDMMVMFKLFMNAKNVALLKKSYYHYQQINPDSLTKQYSKKHIAQVTNNISSIEKYIQERGESELCSFLPFLKLNIKLPLLITNNSDNYELWQNWFCEANKYVLENKMLTFRTRLLQWFAYKKYYIIIKLYYLLVYKFIYGVFFK